ncbi:MAG: hypothetical protein ACP5PQ_00350 [Thermoproteota archaeon]
MEPLEIETRLRGNVATATFTDADRNGLYVFNIRVGKDVEEMGAGWKHDAGLV